MNEIEKMYENAGIEKEVIPCPAKYYGYGCTRNNWDDADCSCDIEGYPPFTPEKQIELIKWLINKYKDISIEHRINMYYIWVPKKYTGEYNIEFSETLSHLICFLWQDLTDEERKQIKEILE